MSSEQFIKHLNRTVPPSPKAALPVVTFNDEATLHLNGEAVHLVHVKNAHTDGDVLVHFPGADVLHMGDCFFNGQYPIVDTGTGGTIDGYIAAVEKGLTLPGAATKIVPGEAGARSRREDEERREVPRGDPGREADGRARRDVGEGLREAGGVR